MHTMGFEPMSVENTADLKSAPLDQLGHVCTICIYYIIFKYFFNYLRYLNNYLYYII